MNSKETLYNLIIGKSHEKIAYQAYSFKWPKDLNDIEIKYRDYFESIFEKYKSELKKDIRLQFISAGLRFCRIKGV